ncbi:hypothetical protein D3C72_1102290 [compost metagenome]
MTHLANDDRVLHGEVVTSNFDHSVTRDHYLLNPRVSFRDHLRDDLVLIEVELEVSRCWVSKPIQVVVIGHVQIKIFCTDDVAGIQTTHQ